MRRREFILLIGVVATWPLVVMAQHKGKILQVGVLANEPWPPLDGLRQMLQKLGYIEGQDLLFEHRFADGRAERYRSLATELVDIQVDVIVAWGTPAVIAARDATSTIPIVMVAGAPLNVGLVSGLAHPGGNVTGLSTQAAEVEAKRLELLKELLPKLSRVAVISNPTNPFCIIAVRDARRGAAALGLQLDVIELSDETQLEKAFTTLTQTRPEAVVVVADPFLVGHRTQIAKLLLENRVPSIYTYREHVMAGGLISYATNYRDLFGRAALFVDKIFKGAKPGNLPVEQPTKFELVVNLSTAKALGLSIPESFLLRADEVIE